MTDASTACGMCSGGFFLFRGGCYDARAAPGSGVCREARDGACVRHAEEVTGQRKSMKAIDRQTSETCIVGSGAGNCKADMCNVWIGGKDYCSECATAEELLIDGKCTNTDSSNICTKDNSKGLCTSCANGYFLHKGGCYKIGGTVGLLICTDTTPSNPADTAGKCTACATGYFKNPTTAGAAVPPCIACNDTTGFADSTGSSNTYKGVLNCEVCSPPTTPAGARADSVAVCTKCGNSKYLKDGTCVESTECKTTTFPKADTSAGNKCVPCNDNTNGGISDCKTCSKTDTTLKCLTCTTDTKKPNADGTKCFACPNSGTTANCDRCSADGVCEACASGKVLTPTLLCLDDCGGLPGYYTDTASKRCAKCSEGCKECTGAATQCTACPAGKRLAYTNSADYGTCVEECAASTGSASGSCRTCGASIGGTKYCSGCSVGAEIPVNGVCQTNPSRAAICAEPDNAGGCNKCATGYFLLEKGCYEAAKQPGVQVCKTADGGLCTTCASGLAASGGDCSAQTCHASCRTCSAASDASKCRTCADGYYKQSSDTTDGECQRCSQGKEGCTLCKYSSGFICLSTDPFSGGSGDNTADPSVNKGGLSSGAIAGISIAVIAVVGGLVSFLCWWFICRGKA
ncbi:hypothetical protein QR46_4866 [Giardia duodenalis assemblage B]|uniref:Variant-specific surface protein n=1 Tax=Giardia duodenalis assemblage B TaxID=1394984 RepID=A0A132NM79_GIAIN|nr:hypothetical protein QR46_4866 [Giardia intestinalis assemblage B]